MITDRDICVALATRGQTADRIAVHDVIAGRAYTCLVDDDAIVALKTMKSQRVRRLPVVDAEGRLKGILSLNDVMTHRRGIAGRNRKHDDEHLRTSSAHDGWPWTKVRQNRRSRAVAAISLVWHFIRGRGSTPEMLYMGTEGDALCPSFSLSCWWCCSLAAAAPFTGRVQVGEDHTTAADYSDLCS
jgi:hypothetical protein